MVMVYTFSFVKRLTQTEAVGSPEPLLIRLQILNGCGVPGAAQDVAEFLLTQESEEIIFDVIDVGNFTDTNISRSLIWDRVGDKITALEVAQLLGIKKDDVSYHLLKNNYLDIKVTLILGRDYQKIIPGEKP
jgi:hypothetical protein